MLSDKDVNLTTPAPKLARRSARKV
eukprot:SAG31_NODE_46736_length_253_cov_0.668831_1_plen_24_part_01